MKKILVLLLFWLCFYSLVEGQAYIKQCIVDGDCDLATVNVTNGTELKAALDTADPGDMIVLAAGNYTPPTGASFNLTRSGTSTNPILIMPSGWPSAPVRATILRHLSLGVASGTQIQHAYAIGLEIYGNSAGSQTDALSLYCDNCGAINNYIWDEPALAGDLDTGNGIGAWNTTPTGNQIIYGNIVYKRQHNIYTANNYTTKGYKYFVSNYSVDAHASPPPATATHIMHAYTEGGFISGMWMERNIFANSSWLLGGRNEPHHHEMIDENYFYNTTPGFGYQRPMWFTFTDNYVGRGGISDQHHWGDGETQYVSIWNDGVVTVTGNTFVNPTGRHYLVTTQAYLAAGNVTCTPNFRSTDVVNNNTYLSDDGLFHGVMCAGGVMRADVDGLTNWRTWSALHGEQFDLNSTQALTSTEPTTSFFIQNEYDADRGFLVVYNWDNDTEISYAGSANWTAYDAKSPYGAPVITGTNTDTIPLDSEFEVFLIVDEAPPSTSCDIAQIVEMNEEAGMLIAQQFAIGMDSDLSFQSRTRKMRKLTLEMGEKNLEIDESLEDCEEVCQ